MRILVIEDEWMVADVIRRSLADCDYDVDIAHDGVVGLKHAMTGEYALIILDLMIPGSDGLSTCRHLRAKGLSTPILLLTGLGITATINDHSLHGADDLMLKPFDVALLQRRVRMLIEESSTATLEVRIGAVLLDMAKQTLAIDGAVVPLTPLEYSLLEFLVRHRGEVMGYRMLGERVWGIGTVSPPVIDILVNAIRMKSGSLRIEYIPRVGYRLE
jgi:two-component system copper resistance phosphate regulon response regulator CusR